MKFQIVILLLLISYRFIAQTKVEHLTIDSKHINETRTLNITLPNQYEKSTKKYPIILVLDDGLLFNTTSAVVNQLSNTSRMPESIVISISPGEKHRNYFAPNLYSNHRKRRYNYGDHQEEFVKFLEFELLPLIEKRYRIHSFKTFVGFSPSSIIGLHTLLHKPNLFQAYICFAAGNIIGDGYKKDERLIENLETLYNKLETKQSYLYIVSGGKDAESQSFINTNVKDFNEKLAKLNNGSIYTKAEIIEGEGHTDVILPGLITAFDFIFPKEKWIVDYIDLIEKEGPAKDNILSFHQNLSDTYGFEVYPNADRLYSMSCLKNVGRRLMQRNKSKEAIEIFKYWVELYPASHLANYYLGLAYGENKEKNMAKTYLEKAYKIALSEKSNTTKVYKETIEKLQD
ncbi:alpha/beta hydrolase-fold protein [Aquimarina sp. D1M17]|uniref:alpha/beta hydrolase-fold protein n=1 Tax=Aquimarina acroporae TaxID=2937283 RepID=UPI0020BE3040|nr:alpha/beta hydrolase-fold protein [Aquimarina acroporae]MCK8522829.1 alpha/beta hydrolase-fold protein [Aquimarina acroporae]